MHKYLQPKVIYWGQIIAAGRPIGRRTEQSRYQALRTSPSMLTFWMRHPKPEIEPCYHVRNYKQVSKILPCYKEYINKVRVP